MIAILQAIGTFFVWLVASPIRWGIAAVLFLAGLAVVYLEPLSRFLGVIQDAIDALLAPVVARFGGWLARLTSWSPYQWVVRFLFDVYVVLWVCRVSVVSVALGWTLAFWSPQARDLLLDVPSQKLLPPLHLDLGDAAGVLGGGDIASEILHAGWLVFFVVFLWAIPVQVCARWSMESRARPPGTALARRVGARTWPPRYPTTFIAKIIPILLGFGCLLAVWIAAAKLQHGLFEGFESTQLARRQLRILEYALLCGSFVYALAVFRSLFDVGERVAAFMDIASSPGQQLNAFLRMLFVLEGLLYRWAGVAAVAGTITLLSFIVLPQLLSDWSRALVIPLVLGAAVPLLSLVTWLSAVLRLPLLILIVGVFVGLRGCVYEGHDIHMQPAPLAQDETRALTFADSVALWRKHNNCGDNTKACPRPIVVAAAGGASRAAFMTASTLGLFMDVTCRDADVQKDTGSCRTTPEFANRLFAISGVSGGALGAAVASGVLWTVQETQNLSQSSAVFPCRRGTAPAQWFGKGEPVGWLQCFQTILAEDFLSRVVIGLAFRDQLPFAAYVFGDRAALLEDTWDETFKKYVNLTPRSAKGLNAPFEYLAPTAKNWRPLLILNGTSVTSGRRIVTSHLMPIGDQNSCLFKDAYDFRSLTLASPSSAVVWNCGAPVAQKDNGKSFSIATAVTNSARFPVISPAGTIRGSDGQMYVDRIVDGGYFENYGVSTAYDIVEALQSAGLDPVALVITNEPILPARAKTLGTTADFLPPLLKNVESLPFAWARAPIGALLETRSSRGDLAMIRLVNLLEGKPQGGYLGTQPFSSYDMTSPDDALIPAPYQAGGSKFLSVAHIAVYPELGIIATDSSTSSAQPLFKDVSMSWWLSKPVQEHLNEQLFRADSSARDQQRLALLQICDWLAHSDRSRDMRSGCRAGLNAAFRKRDVQKALTPSVR